MSTTMATTTTKQDCGCGGKSARGCQCEGALSPCGVGAIRRPSFFAGQLLTEEDLDAIVQYVADKNRLHGRLLYGAGVVCGLTVTVNPCDPRKISIDPGYAIDCCGNDIVVPTVQSCIDVMALIRELRTRLRNGYDCGDPCAEAKKASNNGSTTATPTPITTTPTTTTPTPPSLQTYQLLIRACERTVDYVSPYQVDSCSNTGCQPSRIEESFRFELRCVPPEEIEPPTLNARIDECLARIGGAKRATDVVNGLNALESARKVLVSVGDIASSLTTSAGLKKLSDDLSQAKSGFAKFKSAIDTGLSGDQPAAQVLALVHQAIVLTARARLIAENTLAGEVQEVQTAIVNALQALENSGQLKADFAPLKTRNDLVRAWNPLSPASTFDRKSAIVGDLVDLNLVNQHIKRLGEIRDELLRNAADGLIDIETRHARTLRGGTFADLLPTVDLALFDSLYQQGQVLGQVQFGILGTCFCDALPPPCPTCDDPAVLLATLEVDMIACQVTRVCDQVRQYVLSGPALRYWLARLQTWFSRFRELCCPSDDSRDTTNLLDRPEFKKRRQDWEEQAKELRIPPFARLSPPASGASGSGDTSGFIDQDRARIAGALGQLATITGRSGLNLTDITGGGDPFGLSTWASAGGQPVPADVSQLKDQVKSLQDTVKALQGRIDALGEPAPPLLTRWNKAATGMTAQRKTFLLHEFQQRIKSENTEALATDTNEPNATKSLKRVLGKHLKAIDTLGAKAKSVLQNISLTDLDHMSPEEIHKNCLGDEPAPSDPGFAQFQEDKRQLESFLATVGELGFLVANWPDSIIKREDLHLP